MKTAKFLIATLLLLDFSGPAFAGEKSHSAMRYTTMNQRQEKQENGTVRSLQFDNTAIPDQETAEEQEGEAQSTWERYRALASGKTEEEADELTRNDEKPKKMRRHRIVCAKPRAILPAP